MAQPALRRAPPAPPRHRLRARLRDRGPPGRRYGAAGGVRRRQEAASPEAFRAQRLNARLSALCCDRRAAGDTACRLLRCMRRSAAERFTAIIVRCHQNNSNGGALKSIARRAMLDNGLDPDFAPAVAEQLRGVDKPAREAGAQVRDLRALLWCSIDNDDSRRPETSYQSPRARMNGATRILVAIADVDALVAAGSRSMSTPGTTPPRSTRRHRSSHAAGENYLRI